MATPPDPSTQTPPASPAPTPTPLSLFEKISERWHRASITKKILVGIFGLIITVMMSIPAFLIVTGVARKVHDKKVERAGTKLSAPPAVTPPKAVEPRAESPAPPTSSITYTIPLVPITVNGGTVNGGIHVYVASTHSSTGEKVTPGHPPEDTYVKIVPGTTEIEINPGEIAYADFTNGKQGFNFSYDGSRTNDVRALYDGVPLKEKHDLANTQRVTIQNTGRTPLRLEFSGW